MTNDTKKDIQNFYFTFGVGYDLANCYVVVGAPDEETARKIFVRRRRAAGISNPRFGWSMSYTESEWEAMDRKYRPTIGVSITTPAHRRED